MLSKTMMLWGSKIPPDFSSFLRVPFSTFSSKRSYPLSMLSLSLLWLQIQDNETEKRGSGQSFFWQKGKKHHRVLKLKITLNVFFQCWICPELTLARRAMEHWATPPVRHQKYLQTKISVSLSYFFKFYKNFSIEIKPPFYTKNLRTVWILNENKLVALFILKTRDEREKTHNEILMGQFVGEKKHTSFIPERLRLSKESQPIRPEWYVMSYSGH